jgi:hypothetical protein
MSRDAASSNPTAFRESAFPAAGGVARLVAAKAPAVDVGEAFAN